MFERIVDFALRNRAAVIFFTLVVIIAGVIAFRGLTIEAFPDPTDTQVNVITLFDGQPSEEVERQVSLPIERALNGTPGLARLRSLSLFGLSFVTLTFDDGVDALFARSQVLERLRDAELPDGVIPGLGPLATPIGEVYRYTLASKDRDPMRLRTLQDWVVRPRLLRVQGIADVVSYGGLVREIQVQPKPAQLAARNLTFDDLEDAISKSSANASGGVIQRGAEQMVIRSRGIFRDADDIANVHLGTINGTPVFVRDVATVTEGWTPRQGVVSHNDDFDAIEGIVLMRRGENPSVVLGRLAEAVTELGGTLKPDGVSITPFYDRTALVDTTLETVAHNLIEGAVLVILVLFVFLLDLRAALIVAAVIPLALLSAFIYLKIRGLSANLLSMGAVDFGIIVDGSVVIVEAIIARMALHAATAASTSHHPESVQQAIGIAVRQVVRPTVFALLIIIAAYLPIFLLERVEGRIFAPMANTVVASLVGALVFSVTLVPVLASLAYRKRPKHRDSPLVRWSAKAYEPTLRWALRNPLATLAAGGVLVASAMMVTPKLGSEFLPELNEGAVYATFTLPSNVSLDEARTLVPEITQIFEKSPLVDEVISQLGRPEDGTDATLTSNLEFFVKLYPPDKWPKEIASIGDAIDALSEAVSVVPGVEANFSQPIRDNVNENISGQFGQVAVKLYGDDLVALQETAEKVKNAIANVPGVADLGIVKSGEVPNLLIEPNRPALARFGIEVEELQHIIQAALGGTTAGELWEGERKADVVLRYPLAARNEIEKLRKLPVNIGDGRTIPLESVAQIDIGFGRASISRENGKRYIGIRMNVRGRDLGSFVSEAQHLVESKVPMPRGLRIEWGGEFENKERAMQRLLLVVPLAILITLILLFKAFGKMAPAVLTLLNVPFALIGGLAGLALTGMPISVAAAVGFISLIGLASLNGVLLLSAVIERRQAGQSLERAIVSGCVDRLRPILLTAALAALGLLPAAMSRGIGSETQKPIAIVIVGGTLSACFLTLIMLPVMYSLWSKLAVRLGIGNRAQVPAQPTPTT